MTIIQVNQDIKSGKCKTIYYSAFSLWWTHLDEDVEQATITGREATRKRLQELLNSDKPEAQKLQVSEHLKSLEKSSIPLDPFGSPLYNCDPRYWLNEAIKKPKHFGKHGLKAFIKTHHQNCNNWTPRSWDAVNDYLDRMEIGKKINGSISSVKKCKYCQQPADTVSYREVDSITSKELVCFSCRDKTYKQLKKEGKA